MKILVTGGKGFIGSKIVEMLTIAGHKVTVVDNNDTYGIMTKQELDNLYTWRTRNWVAGNVQVISGDILDRLVCLKAFSHNPDIVIHLACISNDPSFELNPKLGKSIRSLLLDTSIEKSPDSITELLLYAADRSQHVNEIIRPTLDQGDWVISDRFCGSTLAYQGYGRKLDINLIKDLEAIATQGISPDITFLLDIPIEESIRRRINRKDDPE